MRYTAAHLTANHIEPLLMMRASISWKTLRMSAASHLLSDSFWEAQRESCGLVCVSLRRRQFAIPSAFSDSQTLQRREEREHTDCKINFGSCSEFSSFGIKKQKKTTKIGIYYLLVFIFSHLWTWARSPAGCCRSVRGCSRSCCCCCR